MPQLEIVDLSRNKISGFPEEIKHMKALKVLSLTNNRIESVPYVVGNLDTLKILKLTGNPLDQKFKSIVDGSDDSSPPVVAPLGSNEKDVLLTKKIKKYLKSEAAARESGGESRLVH